MRKRWLALAVTACIVFLTACSTTGTPDNEAGPHPHDPVTLTLWHYYVGENQYALEDAVSEFNRTVGMEEGVIVEAVAKGSISELEEAVTNSARGVINSEPMPDIFSSYADKAMELDEMGVVCDMSAYFTAEEQQLYVSGFIADCIFEGDRLLVVPVVKSTELMYVNDTAWGEFSENSGIDSETLLTWEGIYETARAYYEWTGGEAFIGVDSVANFIIVGAKQLGVDVIDGDGEQVVLDENALRSVFDVYFKGMSLGYFDAVGKFRSDDIKSGILISYVGSSSSAAYFPTWVEQDNTQSPIDFLALPFPHFENGSALAIQQGAGMSVSKSTSEKETAAALFLKWFTAPEQNIEFAMTTGYLPVETAAYQSPDFESILTDLRGGEAAQKNVADVYEIALRQITEADTYAAKPFTGSYSVRSLLQSTMADMLENWYATVGEMRLQGAGEEEILAALNIDARFAEWMAALKTELDAMGIAWK